MSTDVTPATLTPAMQETVSLWIVVKHFLGMLAHRNDPPEVEDVLDGICRLMLESGQMPQIPGMPPWPAISIRIGLTDPYREEEGVPDRTLLSLHETQQNFEHYFSALGYLFWEMAVGGDVALLARYVSVTPDNDWLLRISPRSTDIQWPPVKAVNRSDLTALRAQAAPASPEYPLGAPSYNTVGKFKFKPKSE